MSVLASITHAARTPRMAPWRLLVAASWFTAGLCLVLTLTGVVRFTFHPSDSGILGWVGAVRYPKQQELFWFLATVAGVPAIMLAGWCAWVGVSAVAARLSGGGPGLLLKLGALCHLPLLTIWPVMLRLQVDAATLPPAVGKALLLVAATALVVRCLPSRFRGCSQSSPAPATAAPAPDAPHAPHADHAAPDRLPPARNTWTGRCRRGLCRAWRVAVWLLFYVAVPGLAYLLYLAPGCDRGVDLFHEGEFLVPLDALLHGGIPYRDVYLQHGLFHNAWIPYFGATRFEPSLLGVRMVFSYIAPLGFLSYYYLVLTVFRTRVLAVFFAYAGCSVLGYALDRATFGILSVTVLAAALVPGPGFRILAPGRDGSEPRPRPLRRAAMCVRRGWPLMLAGALAMLAFWHSVEIGMYALTAGMVFLTLVGIGRGDVRPWRRALPLACYVIGAAVAFLPIALYLARHGAFDDMLRNVWIQCVHQIETWGLAFPSFFGVFKPILTAPEPPRWQVWLVNGHVQFYYGPAMLTLAAAYLAFRAMGAGFWHSRTGPVLLLLTLAGACFFRTTLGRSDWYHILNGFMFALVLLLFLVDRLLAAAWDRLTARHVSLARRLLVLPWLAAGLAAGAGAYAIVDLFKPLPAFKSRWERFHKWPPATTGTSETVPRAGLTVLPADQVKQINSVVDFIRQHSAPDERIFDFSSQAGLLFFAGRRSVSRYFQVCYACTPDLQQEVIDDMERVRPRLIIFRGGTYFDAIDKVAAAARHPVLYRYLQDHYEPAGKAGKVEFWRRRDDAVLSAQSR